MIMKTIIVKKNLVILTIDLIIMKIVQIFNLKNQKNQSNYFNISNHESNCKYSGFSTNNFEDILRQSQKQSNISKKTRSTQPATHVSQVVIQSTSCKKTPLNNQINSNLVSVTEIRQI